MAIKLADTLAPMADFPAAMAENIAFEDGKSLQEKYNNGELGNSGSGEVTEEKFVKKTEIDNSGVKNSELILLVDGEFTTTEGTEQEYPYYKITVSSGELKQNTRLNKATLYEIVVDGITYNFKGEESFNLDDGFKKGEFVGNSTMVDSTYYTANTTNEDLDWVLIADTSASSFLYIMTKTPKTIKLKVSRHVRTVVPFFKDLIFGSLFEPFFIKADGSAYSNVSIAGANKIDAVRRGVLAIGDCNAIGENSEFDITFGYGNSAKTSNYNAIVGTNNKIEEGKVSGNTGSEHIFGYGNTSKGYNNYIVGAQNSVHAGWSTVLGTFCTVDGGVICSSAIGYDTACHANLSTAIGPRANVKKGAECSTAIGKYVIAAHKGQVALGFGNKGSEKNLLEIGNGKDAEGKYIYEYGFPKEEDITRDNAFEITYDGVATAKTGIGVDDVTLTKEDLTTLKNIPVEVEEVKNKVDGIISDSSTSTTSTWSSSKITEYVAENAAPTYSGTVIPTSITSGATVTTDWDISSAGENADYGRLLMLNSKDGSFLLYVKGNLGNTSTMPTPTVISSIGNSQSASWSSSFELSISSGKLRIKNKSGAVASWRFV